MKLKVASIFTEYMVLQRNKPITIWGRSAKDDTIEVKLADKQKTTIAEDGQWSITFDPLEACDEISLSVHSSITGENISFNHIAVGDVFLAGGQSNMEFLMKYDIDFEETAKTENDALLRCYTAPQSAFIGAEEIDPYGNSGFWRRWILKEERQYFTAVATYMGMKLREKLNIPIGIISCNWGGSPACAWTAREDLENTAELKPILDWEEKFLKETDWPRYIPASEKRIIQTKEEIAFNDRFMMGEDMSEFIKNFDPSVLPKVDFAPFNLGPRCVVRPSGLYENMLCKIAPYGIKAFLWYQGEDDDARDFVDFYDVSMITLIKSWRKLWKEDLPFYQIELAPFRGIGPTAAKRYPVMRHQQAKAAASLNDVYDLCILDAGEEYNIHPRHKKIVGERLSRSVLKHSYGFDEYIGDSPRALSFDKQGDTITILFSHTGKGLECKGDLKKYLLVTHQGKELDYTAEIKNNRLILKGPFHDKTVRIEFCESNYCVDPLFNSDNDPVFAFTAEV